MRNGFFITGTDTDVGKTYLAVQLLNAFNAAGLTTAALKPIASGCVSTEAGLRNQDALLLQQAASLKFSYEEVNPIAIPLPIAPYLTNAEVQPSLTVNKLLINCQSILKCSADYILVEGVGGWQVPLNETETMADLAKELELPVILVVAMRLGCLNHALLTWGAIKHKGVKITGWVANCLDPNMQFLTENIATLARQFGMAPLISLNLHEKLFRLPKTIIDQIL